MYAVIVQFKVRGEWRKDFQETVLKNAARSLQEPGCRRFDVCFSVDGSECFLYELYKGRAALEEHLVTPHFKEFDQVTEPFVITKRVETYLLHPNPYADGI